MVTLGVSCLQHSPKPEHDNRPTNERVSAERSENRPGSGDKPNKPGSRDTQGSHLAQDPCLTQSNALPQNCYFSHDPNLQISHFPQEQHLINYSQPEHSNNIINFELTLPHHPNKLQTRLPASDPAIILHCLNVCQVLCL